MWKEEINGIGQRFAEAYSIPKDVIANATLLHVVGMSEIFLENFQTAPLSPKNREAAQTNP